MAATEPTTDAEQADDVLETLSDIFPFDTVRPSITGRYEYVVEMGDQFNCLTGHELDEARAAGFVVESIHVESRIVYLRHAE